MVSSPTSYSSVQEEDGRLNGRLDSLRYQALLQQAEIGLCSVFNTGTVDFATTHFCRMVNRSQQQVVGHKLWDILDAADMEVGPLQHLWSTIVNRSVDQAIDRTVTGPEQIKTYGKTEQSIVWQWKLQPIVQDNRVVEVQCVVEVQPIVMQAVFLKEDLQEDLTEDLQEQNASESLQQLAEHLQQVFWIYDMEIERLIYVSPACAVLLGRSRSDCAARSWSDWMGEVHPADLESVLKVSRQLMRGISSEVTYRLIPPDRMQSDSDVRWLMTRAVPVCNAAGRVYRIMAATEDVTDRQKQNRWLRLLESVIVNANDAVVITEAEPVQLPGPHIVYVNQAFTRMLGYQPEEIVGQTPRILQGINTDPQILAHIRSNLKAWKPVLVEIINYHKNGREVWIELSIFPVKDQTGHHDYWVAIQRDITDRKQADAARQRQALRSQILTDLTLKIRRSLQLDEILQTTVTEVRSLLKVDRVLLFRRLGNGQGQIYSESVEPEFPSLLGQEIEEADFFAEPVQLYERSTVQTLERLNEDHWQSRGANYLQALGIRSLMVIPISQQKRIWGWLIAHHTSHRHWSSFEVDLLQQLPAPLEVAITQSQLLQALQESEERFRTLANRAPVLLWSLDSHGQCVFCNQGLLDFLGMDMTGARGLGWLVAVHHSDRERVIAHHCLALQTRESHELEYRLRRSDGTYRWVLDRSVPQWSGAGEFSGLVISCWDMTDRKQVEDEMQIALTRERELSELKSRLVSTTSHEFRTPLSTILSSADLLEFYGDRVTPDKQMEHIQRIQNAAVNMNNLLSDLLLIERADAKKLKFEPAQVEVRSLCQAVIDELSWSASVSDTLNFHNRHLQTRNESGRQEQQSLEERPELPESLQTLKEFGCSSIQFLSEPNEGLILANVDEKLMRQILMNLLTNAIKYSDPGHPIRFTLTATTDQLTLIVQDWGIGIPSADQERLFEPFHRAMNVKSIPGNGLGLAIVQQSVKVHQGRIKILSTLGEGTTVTVELPRWSTESSDFGS
jgi:PAS domain S-box-containing protein